MKAHPDRSGAQNAIGSQPEEIGLRVLVKVLACRRVTCEARAKSGAQLGDKSDYTAEHHVTLTRRPFILFVASVANLQLMTL